MGRLAPGALALSLLVSLGAGCDERKVKATDGAIRDAADATADGRAKDAPWLDGNSIDVTVDARALDARPDAIADAGPLPCGCQPGEVWIKSACAPTLELGCAPRCSGGCSKSGYSCEPCGAQPDCTKASASSCAPACLPSKGSPSTPLPAPLRIQPTDGPAGQQALVLVEGAPFYIGALFYLIRVNGGTGVADQPVSKPCATSLRFTPPSPGVYTIEVSQYGGGGPWVLAGFFTASAGAPPSGYIQPGFQCTPSDTCLSGPGYSCSCQSGRCRCQ